MKAHTFDIALSVIVDDRATLRQLVREIGPIAWPKFNRMCWTLYGTGRTEPDHE